MRSTLTIMAMVILPLAWGQESAASIEFFSGLTDCAASLGGWKCLELDLSSEAAAENDSAKVYEYSWNFGDGNRKPGNKIEHCYQEFGSYQVTMDLIDVETNTVIRNELSSTLHLYPEIYPAIITNRENLPPTFVEFSFKYNDADNFEPDRVYWRIDGAYYEGTTITHSFPVAGVYLVEMGVEKNMDFLGTVAACSSTEVTIKESDVWSTEIMNFVKKEREKSNAGPFAYSDVMCSIKANEGDRSGFFQVPLHTLMSKAILKVGHEYEIMLFSGSIFTEKKNLNTYGITGNDLYRALKDTISSFLKRPLQSLPSARFEKNQTNQVADETTLKLLADMLLQYASLQVAVGSYMHSGSRMSKGIQTSVTRASVVKDMLVKYGVSPERISVESPEYHHALVNTCSALPDCDWENEKLNGKVELKITGTNL
ncbi:MAG: PKD domain-containing protein [Cyclobacteriaceae bacterium]